MKIVYYPVWNIRFFCQDKNASTTLFNFFEGLYPGVSLVHWDATTRNMHAPFNKSRFEVCFPTVSREFTVVRNTWSRIESLYFMLTNQFRGKEIGIEQGKLHTWFEPFESEIVDILEQHYPFPSFVEYICSFDDDACDSHWQPQAFLLPLGSANFRVLRLETLSADFENFVADILPLSLQNAISFNVRDSDSSITAEDLWSRKTVSAVAQRYAHEISIFGFQPPPVRH